jgi:uncharacterized SAM-binding protein YcdF (DUF218 family)
MVLLFVAAASAIAYVTSVRRDARLLRNGVFLSATIVFAVLGALIVAAPYTPLAGVALVGLLLIVPIAVVVLGVALLVNGWTMLRREGRSVSNQLSLIAGVGVFVLPAVSLGLIQTLGQSGLVLAGLVAIVSVYLSTAFVSFALYSIVYARRRRVADPAAIVVHGAGLMCGQVTPLLRGRLDRALEVYRAAVREGEKRPVLVPSGGQGTDESRAEATAMAEYLREQGVPHLDIMPEDHSRTTEENLQLSQALLREADINGPIVLVTSDYHVLRTASLARRSGIDGHVVGSRTASYYVPSAFLREFVALLVENRWVTVMFLTPFVVMAGVLITALVRG